MGDGRIFLKTRCDASFNKDLSNEPKFRPDPYRWTVPLNLNSIDFRSIVMRFPSRPTGEISKNVLFFFLYIFLAG
jgi:hypothetical protein